MATMPYSEDFCATLALIDAFKHQEYHNGLTSKVKKGLMSVMGLDNTQLVNVLNKYGVTAYRFFDAMLKIKILPTYKGVVYPTLLDMCNSTRLTLKEVLDESNLQKIIKGDTLDFVFK